ncbi:MAG TPA: phosphoribosylglycinamide formyltransferase [Polyangia bacterium]|jgi:phosphoribosylglycinamide formyltransferase-1|nr:phosphoribosylglycinamide formyltransferase [Polyangia bacterium]
MRVGVLASGSGTNLQSLIDSAASGALGPASLAVVGVNVPDCGALARARGAGIPTFVVDHRGFAQRALFDQALLGALRLHDVELVVLAGFMRLLGADLLAAFPARVINVHPALLPAFPGVKAQAQSFAYGVKIAGCTVHFVDTGVDSGVVIAQAAVPVLDSDDAEALRLRILALEHQLLPAVVRAFAEGRVFVEGRRVRVVGEKASPDRLVSL